MHLTPVYTGSGFFYDAPTERHVLSGGGTYGIARRSASLSHRLSYDAPLVRESRNKQSGSRAPRAGEHDMGRLPSSAGERWNESTPKHDCIFTSNCGALQSAKLFGDPWIICIFTSNCGALQSYMGVWKIIPRPKWILKHDSARKHKV